MNYFMKKIDYNPDSYYPIILTPTWSILLLSFIESFIKIQICKYPQVNLISKDTLELFKIMSREENFLIISKNYTMKIVLNDNLESFTFAGKSDWSIEFKTW